MQQFRVILAVGLSMLVLWGYFHFFAPPAPQQKQEQQKSPPPSSQQVQSEKKDGGVPTGTEENLPILPSDVITGSPTFEVENNDIKAVFSAKGAVLSSLILKKFHTRTAEKSAPTNLLEGQGIALQVTTGSSASLSDYRLVEDKTEEGKRSIVFEASVDSLKITKKFVFSSSAEPHSFDLYVEWTNLGAQETEITPRLWVSYPQKKVEERKGLFSFLKGQPNLFEPLVFLNNALHHGPQWDKLPAKTDIQGKIYWAGLSDRYFLSSLIGRQESDNVSAEYGRNGNRLYASLSYGSLSLRPDEKKEKKYSAYFGPKKRENLERLGVNLEKSVDYGWFEFMAIPLLWLLIQLEKFLGNWGLAIISLTFIVKMILHPVNKKSMQSMKEMQKLQPRLQELREKYKDNKEKLNAEMMLLFKTHKVNPMGGCLPMLLQMPVYIALYNVLWNAVELYQAPFFWFYHDLSAPDPFMLTPILLAIFMVLQQKFTPQTTMDPAQQKMMMFMPIMFAGFMIFLPFGLVLYILVNTIMSVVQQYMVQHDMSLVDIIGKLKRT